ncbi:hypothetical protein BJX70DRAFT_406370 [Aspergillus crustosus]
MGTADIVGFWAETQQSGGVVLFHHGKDDNEFLDPFLHPDARYKVFRLSSAQIDHFLTFSGRDADRVRAKYSLLHNIYRTRNDRRQPRMPRGCLPPGRMEDDPYMMEFIERFNKVEVP